MGGRNRSCRLPRTPLMLFLRALLFFILGTFAGAVPLDHDIAPGYRSVVPHIRKWLSGYWYAPVSENLSYLIWSLRCNGTLPFVSVTNLALTEEGGTIPVTKRISGAESATIYTCHVVVAKGRSYNCELLPDLSRTTLPRLPCGATELFPNATVSIAGERYKPFEAERSSFQVPFHILRLPRRLVRYGP